MSQYDDTHRAFLQAFMSRGTLTYTEAQPILAAILTAANPSRPTLPADIDRPTFYAHLGTLNTHLHPFDLEIRNARSQHTRSMLYALVNTASDPLTQLATTRSPDELAFVKRCLDAMFETYNTRSREVLAVSRVQGLNLARGRGGGGRGSLGATQATQGSAGAGLTMGQAERVLDEMVSEGWFEESEAGFVSLGTRALVELRGWLVDTYNEVLEGDGDEGGGEGVVRVRGQRCANYDCGARLHDGCTQRYFERQSTRKCPSCGAEWTGGHFVGERAALSAAKAKASSARRGWGVGMVEEEEDEVGEGDGEEGEGEDGDGDEGEEEDGDMSE
ncbi:hypothetical protein EJ05DRAFT_524638 [Pseudovirgaria hyperparasitica]|uniref:Non-structural maintenance of chromosomes element 1 homolog n=1 Tax=Pseudovirgaria hyperparasitica TaxID=470096 RepID=A0A6A6WH53_9PEZI|nr:uncharacterized protein EJ05DRAFT_524638 [Pseudovirgaria hyperparasitica]KAF2761316.1 hypothetical protein EJ05DRAFT_524638 [Pseudovirgaria hyperparasitica]